MSERTKNDDLACVLFFLAGAAQENATHQGWTGAQAFDAACRLLNMDRRKFITRFEVEQSRAQKG